MTKKKIENALTVWVQRKSDLFKESWAVGCYAKVEEGGALVIRNDNHQVVGGYSRDCWRDFFFEEVE